MLDDLTENFSSLLFSLSLLLLLLLLLLFDKFRGKMLLGSVKDVLVDRPEIRLGGGSPNTVFIKRALLKLDIS